MNKRPQISVVLVAADRYERIRKAVGRLADQTVSEALQLVVVSLCELPDAHDDRWAAFADVKFVRAGQLETPGEARARGAAQCLAPIISFGEDHCFPETTWAETLIALFEEGWAGVGPALANANPGAVSWADLMLNHGAFAYPAVTGPVDGTPWHNTSYRRDLLLEFGPQLGHMLEAEIRLHAELLRRGHRLYLAGELKANHVNLSRWTSFLHCQMWGGRLYGAARAEVSGWSSAKRWFRAASFPLIPLIRAPRILADARRAKGGWPSLSFLLACAGGGVAAAAGEVAGYAFGAGRAEQARVTYEFDRVRHVRREDRKLLA